MDLKERVLSNELNKGFTVCSGDDRNRGSKITSLPSEVLLILIDETPDVSYHVE